MHSHNNYFNSARVSNRFDVLTLNIILRAKKINVLRNDLNIGWGLSNSAQIIHWSGRERERGRE